MKGSVYWITGLSGAGKTTIGKLFYRWLKSTREKVILLDGNNLRKIFGKNYGYNLNDRFKLAMNYSKLCKLISDQGVNVVIATISMFHKCHQWNRANIQNYREIYISILSDHI